MTIQLIVSTSTLIFLFLNISKLTLKKYCLHRSYPLKHFYHTEKALGKRAKRLRSFYKNNCILNNKVQYNLKAIEKFND